MRSPPLTPLSEGLLVALRYRAHPSCVVCGSANPHGLGIEFTCAADGSVRGELADATGFQGYTGQVHGGIIAALLDGAMTNCLFAHACEAMTAELKVRYRHPVLAAAAITVRARLAESHGPLLLLRAELVQHGRVKATATGKFMAVPVQDRAPVAVDPCAATASLKPCH